MGYFTERYRGKDYVCCDRCGVSNATADAGVRKRTCPHKVTLEDGVSKLPYCPAPNVCKKCFAELGGTKGLHGKNCSDGAASSNVKYAEERAQLNKGAYKVVSAWGDWADGVPKGDVKVKFVNKWDKTQTFTMKSENYDQTTKRYLHDYDPTSLVEVG